MRRRAACRVMAVVVVLLLQSCGGGGGSGGGQNQNNDPRLTVTPSNVSVEATPGEVAPPGAVTLTVTNPPRKGLYLSTRVSTFGIESISVFPVNQTQVNLNIAFRSPGSLQNGTYTDTLSIRVCPDDQCAAQIDGSPVDVKTSYQVSGTGTARATLDRNLIHFTADEGEPNNRSEQVRVTLDEAPASGTQLSFSHTTHAIQSVEMSRTSTSETVFTLVFNPTELTGHGVFEDTVTINVCYDLSCARHVEGSPFTIATTEIIGVGPEFGYEPLVVESRAALAHNIIDAEFSKALNAIVMVGSEPANALYVYDVATGIERQQPLSKLPAALSIAPDGLTAAVGHDALITVVDLATVGQPGAPPPTLLDVSADVYGLVLDGRGSVHVIPRFGTWVHAHSIEVATNTEQLGTDLMGSDAYVRMHPSGNYIYTTGDGSQSTDLFKWDIRSGVVESLYDSPYFGEHDFCGRVWFDESGATIYSACGNTFVASDVQADDMVYVDTLQLASGTPFDFKIGHLSQSAAQKVIALIEYDRNCVSIAPQGPCYTHLAYHNSASLRRKAVFTIPPVTVAATDYSQRGLYVFRDAVNGKKYLLSRLEKMADPAAEYYVSVIP